jgi:hypothetical protein
MSPCGSRRIRPASARVTVVFPCSANVPASRSTIEVRRTWQCRSPGSAPPRLSVSAGRTIHSTYTIAGQCPGAVHRDAIASTARSSHSRTSSTNAHPYRLRSLMALRRPIEFTKHFPPCCLLAFLFRGQSRKDSAASSVPRIHSFPPLPPLGGCATRLSGR